VAIEFCGREGRFDVNALVDSGAEHNVFPVSVAERLDLDYKSERRVTIVGVAGQSSGYLVPAELRLGRYWWAAPVIFSEAVDRQGMLGQLGFFKFFNVDFRYGDKVMDIRRRRI